MRTLYLDCETNGLPTGGRPHFSNIRSWPHAVSVSWQLWEGPALVEEFDAIVKPRAGMKWDLGAQCFHGISKETAEQEGQEISDVLAALRLAIAGADLVVAHNMEFDKNILLAEAVRLQGTGAAAAAWLWPFTKREFCTMKSTVNLVKAPPFKNCNYKFPRQDELHRFLFGCDFDMPLHNSKNDVVCLVKCHQGLMRRS